MVKNREAWFAAGHGVTKSQPWLTEPHNKANLQNGYNLTYIVMTVKTTQRNLWNFQEKHRNVFEVPYVKA